MTENSEEIMHTDEDKRTRAFAHIENPRRRAFLVAYALMGNKRMAAEAAGIHRDTEYSPGWRQDRDFQEGLEVARRMAGDRLEEEAARRAMEGVKRYRFHSRTGEVLRHPEECVCGHPIGNHVRGESGKRPCPESGCEDFEGRPYVDHEYSDTLMVQLLKSHLPERYTDRLEVRGTLAKLDLGRLPDGAVQRIAAGENAMAVLASLGPEEQKVLAGEVVVESESDEDG